MRNLNITAKLRIEDYGEKGIMNQSAGSLMIDCHRWSGRLYSFFIDSAVTPQI